jgi:hypothetical protein
MRRVDEAIVAERVERVDDALHAGPVEHGDRARLLVGKFCLRQDFARFAAHGRATFHGSRLQGSVLLGAHAIVAGGHPGKVFT